MEAGTAENCGPGFFVIIKVIQGDDCITISLSKKKREGNLSLLNMKCIRMAYQ